MIYINDPNQPYKTYDELVTIATNNGVDRKRVYIYLAALGVKSAPAKVVASDSADYLEPIKIAVKNGQVVTSVSVCGDCGGLVFNVQ